MFTSIGTTVNVWLFSSWLVHWSGRLETSHKLTLSIADFLYEFWHHNFSKSPHFSAFPVIIAPVSIPQQGHVKEFHVVVTAYMTFGQSINHSLSFCEI